MEALGPHRFLDQLIVPARADLATGDHRLLYVGWLLAAQSGDLDNDEIFPPVPAGLSELSGAVQAVAAFLRIDTDLVAAAAEYSPPAPAGHADGDLAAWVDRLAAAEKDAMLLGVMRGEAQATRDCSSDFAPRSAPTSAARRTVCCRGSAN